MAVKSHKYKIEHNDFSSMQIAFNDCVRYSQAKILFIDAISATIEIPPSGNPSMRKEFLKLCVDRWESC